MDIKVINQIKSKDDFQEPIIIKKSKREWGIEKRE